MKKLLTSFTLLICIASEAQIIYRYDAGGNRKYKGTNLTIVNGGARLEKDSLRSQPSSFNINVFPNPASGQLNIHIQNFPADSLSAYSISNMSGITMLNKSINNGVNTEDLSDYPAGVYILQVWIGKNKKEWKVLKE